MNVTIEPLAVTHAAHMVEVLADPGLYAMTGGAPPDLAELTERFERQIRGSGRAGERWLNWVILLDRRAVGTVQATVVSDGDGLAAALAWLVGVRWQRRGIATHATRAAVDELRASLGVTRLRANIAPGHVASEAVARKLGLVVTAELADGERVWAAQI